MGFFWRSTFFFHFFFNRCIVILKLNYTFAETKHQNIMKNTTNHRVKNIRISDLIKGFHPEMGKVICKVIEINETSFYCRDAYGNTFDVDFFDVIQNYTELKVRKAKSHVKTNSKHDQLKSILPKFEEHFRNELYVNAWEGKWYFGLKISIFKRYCETMMLDQDEFKSALSFNHIDLNEYA